MNHPLVVVDEGSNQIKAVWYNAHDKTISSRIIPSRVTAENGEDQDGMPFPYVYQIDDQYYSVVDNANGQLLPTQSKEYQVSNHNLALVHEVLRPSFGDQAIHLQVTLPIFQFYNLDNTRNSERVSEKQAVLMKAVTNPSGQPLATFNSVNVSPEGIPVWFDVLFDQNIQFNKDFEFVEKVLVVDIGGTTTDISLITGGGRIIQKRSIEVGCFKVADHLRSLVKANGASHVAMEKAMKTKSFRRNDISAELLQAVKPVAEHIYHEMNVFEADSAALDYVVYAGGGANLLGTQLEKLYGGNTLIPDEPELSLARGILKHKMVLAQRQAQKESAEA